jgi:hypothetical protein
MQEGANQRGS